jgi:hypothetical protein
MIGSPRRCNHGARHEWSEAEISKMRSLREYGVTDAGLALRFQTSAPTILRLIGAGGRKKALEVA